MAKVYIKFPKTGLGNMLLVWARGVVFAKLNDIGYTTSYWWGFRWGTIIRREQRSRLYWGYFKETPLLKQLAIKLSLLYGKINHEPLVKKTDAIDMPEKLVFVFNKIVVDDDFFGAIRNHKDIVVAELYKTLAPKMKMRLQRYPIPVIGVHIRRGDFKMGSTITPLHFFIEGIGLVRKQTGENLPVTIFTDADRNEIEEILKLPNVVLAEKKPDILDILLLSKSKIMFLSNGSSFSYWAAFLSDALVIRPVNDWQKQINYPQPYSNYTEVVWHCGDEASAKEVEKKINDLYR